MSNQNPLGKSAASAILELMRRERERTDLMKRALGPASDLQKQLEALKNPLARYAEMQKSSVFGQVQEAMRLYPDTFKNLRYIANPHWASALQETALAISRQGDDIRKKLGLLSISLDSSILRTAQALHSQNAILATALAANKWQDQFKALSEQLTPSLMAFRATAERMAMLDMQTLRATAEQWQSSAAQTAAQQAIEAQYLIEAFAHTDSPEEGAKIFAAVVALIATMVAHFKGNTVEELRKAGLIQILSILSMIIAFMPGDTPQGLTPDQQRSFAEMRSEIESLQGQIHELRETENTLNEAYVSDLPRAELARKSNIRRAPSKEAPKVLIADPGTLVAVVRSAGRWKLVVFRDPLTDQLSQGWVYNQSVTMLDP